MLPEVTVTIYYYVIEQLWYTSVHMAVTDVSKYETVSTELWTKIKPDLTRPKISSGIDWDGLFELKMQS